VAGNKSLERYAVIRVADNTTDQQTALAITQALLNSITQEDLQTYVLSQIKRIVWGDLANQHWYDDFESENVAPLYRIYVDILLSADPVIASNFTPTYTGNKLTHELWSNPLNSHPIKTVQYTYSSSKLIQEVRTVFAGDGITIWGQITVSYSYSGSRLISETVVRNV
jgi:hypothetical protein